MTLKEKNTMAETSADVVRRYLEDAIAAEKSVETQLQEFAREGENTAAKSAFEQHALETKKQHERLAARLENLGGSVSGAKTLLAHIFGLSSKAARAGREGQGRTTQNLMLAFAAENSELAMYETLAAIAEAAGDPETASMARSIQEEEKATAEKFWLLLPEAALQDCQHLTREVASDHAKRPIV